jgi:hypothetical protein
MTGHERNVVIAMILAKPQKEGIYTRYPPLRRLDFAGVRNSAQF